MCRLPLACGAVGLPNLERIALEQVPFLEYAFEDLAAELYGADWQTVHIETLDACDLGVASRRRRVFLVARRFETAIHRLGLNRGSAPLRTDLFRVPRTGPEQLTFAL